MTARCVNPIAEGAQISVVRDGSRYLWLRADGETGVAVWTSDRIGTLGRRHLVWSAPAGGPARRGVRPSDIVKRDGRWFVYLSAHDGEEGNRLAFVLAADADDPLGPYTLDGPLATGEQDPPWPSEVWSADMTVFEHAGRCYAVWSGWPGRRNEIQQLYVDELVEPTRLAGKRAPIGSPGDFEWERPDARSPGINEAPRVLARDGRTFLVYSCGAAWLPSYRLGMAELLGDDPRDPASWHKFSEPVFSSTESTRGVGHASFVVDSAEQWWMVYDAKWDEEPDWRRAVNVQPIEWAADGTPALGEPVPPGHEVVLSGPAEPAPVDGKRRWQFGDDAALDDFDYYGHHQFFGVTPEGLDLGAEPREPVNGFRSGEKIVLRDGEYTDLRATVSFQVVSGDRDVGMLFRVTGAALGFDAQRGYYAAVSPIRGSLVLGKMDGRSWTEIGFSKLPIDTTAPTILTVEARGDRLSVAMGDPAEVVLVVRDHDFGGGSIGCRVVDTHGRFEWLEVAPLT